MTTPPNTVPPTIRGYQQATQLEPTDAFVIDRLGVGTMYIEGSALADGFGTLMFQVGFEHPYGFAIVVGDYADVPFDTNSIVDFDPPYPPLFDPNGVFHLNFPDPLQTNQSTITAATGQLTIVSNVSGGPIYDNVPAAVTNRYLVTGPGVTAGTYLIGQVSGDDFSGVFTLNQTVTIASPVEVTIQHIVSAFVAPVDGSYALNAQVFFGADTSKYYGLYSGATLYMKMHKGTAPFALGGQVEVIVYVPTSSATGAIPFVGNIGAFWKMQAGDYVSITAIATPIQPPGDDTSGVTIAIGSTFFNGQRIA